jgi:hypothetical protein
MRWLAWTAACIAQQRSAAQRRARQRRPTGECSGARSRGREVAGCCRLPCLDGGGKLISTTRPMRRVAQRSGNEAAMSILKLRDRLGSPAAEGLRLRCYWIGLDWTGPDCASGVSLRGGMNEGQFSTMG